MPVTVDIVLPCYNPNDTWPSELLSFDAFIKDHCTVNYIVVNDGSPGNKLPEQIIGLQQKNISVTYISYQKNQGKGYALRQGVLASRNEYVVYTDIDFPFTSQSISDLIHSLLGGGYDVVAGYRNEGYYEKKMSAFRKLLSKAFRYFIKKILKMTITDTQCGLKGFNKKGKEKFLATKINRYLFDFEFIYLSGKDKTLRINPVQVQLKENVIFSKMRLKIIAQESFNLLSVLLFSKN